MIVYRAYSQYMVYKKQLRMRNRSVNEQVDFSYAELQADLNYKLLKSSVKFAVPAFIYVVFYYPVGLSQIIATYNGPFQGKTGAHVILSFWFYSAGNVTTLINITFYGLLDKTLRAEIVEILGKQWQKRTHKHRRFQRVSENFDREALDQNQLDQKDDENDPTNDGNIESFYNDELDWKIDNRKDLSKQQGLFEWLRKWMTEIFEPIKLTLSVLWKLILIG